jgi:hypothetical protein
MLLLLGKVAGMFNLSIVARSSVCFFCRAGIRHTARPSCVINVLKAGVSAMRWSALSLFSLLGLLVSAPWAQADSQDYSVLIISRERLEVATSCEIGLYIQDQLVGRLFQEESTSINLAPGKTTVRLRLLPGQVPGCQPGMDVPPAMAIELRAGEVRKYQIATGPHGMYLKQMALGY